jgi:hypothetical protein
MPDADDDANQPDQHPDTDRQPDHRPWHYRTADSADPSSPFRPRDPIRRRWHNTGLRIGNSTRVHAVRFAPRPDGSERVAPACHTGHDRGDNSADLHPVHNEPISCLNCRTWPIALNEGQPYDPARNQYMLDLPGIPPPPSWPPAAPGQDDEPDGSAES